MSDASLLFAAQADGSGLLVFGEQGNSPAPLPGAAIAVDALLPGLDGPVVLRCPFPVAVDAELPGLDGQVRLRWDANVSRGLRAPLQAMWQQATPVQQPLRTHWQGSMPLAMGLSGRWQEATVRQSALALRWQHNAALQAALSKHWQEAVPLRAALLVRWQHNVALRAALWAHWQEGQPVRSAALLRWQEMLRLRRALRAHWQQAMPQRAQLRSRFTDAQRQHQALRPHWQEAMRPLPGVSEIPRPPRLPCWDAATLGRLIFTEAWDASGLLVFMCQRGGQALPPATIYVPGRRSYIVINHIEIRRADTGEVLPSEAFAMSLDADSWTWSWSATFAREALARLQPAADGLPVEVEARINGQPLRLLAERLGRSVRFPERLVKVSGRGRAALLDAPYAPVQTFSPATSVSAQQLMQEVLTINGVGMGWSLDWHLPDWQVPASVWTHQGSWASACADIAAAVGGYLQPHDTDAQLRVLPRWPQPWWRWAGMAPDIELPAGVAEIEETEWTDRPAYNRVFVSGESGGVLGDYKRAGTAGELLAPMAVHPLITDETAARARAEAELCNTGRQIMQTLTLMVLPATGVIKPGTVLRYTDDSGLPRLGIVRSTSINWSFPVLTQTIGVESHA